MQHWEKKRCNINSETVLSLHGMAASWGSAADEPARCSGQSWSWSFSLTGIGTWQGSLEKQTLGPKLAESYSLFLVELIFIFDSLSLQTSSSQA